jgi:hypothetical protein
MKAFRSLISGTVTKVKFIVALYLDHGVSPYSAAQFIWLFDDMDEVTEEIWVESFAQVASMWTSLKYSAVKPRQVRDRPELTIEDLLETPDYKSRMRGHFTSGYKSVAASTAYSSPMHSPRHDNLFDSTEDLNLASPKKLTPDSPRLGRLVNVNQLY